MNIVYTQIKELLTANAGRSALGRPGWLRRASTPYAGLSSDSGQCHKRQNAGCPPPGGAPDPAGI